MTCVPCGASVTVLPAGTSMPSVWRMRDMPSDAVTTCSSAMAARGVAALSSRSECGPPTRVR